VSLLDSQVLLFVLGVCMCEYMFCFVRWPFHAQCSVNCVVRNTIGVHVVFYVVLWPVLFLCFVRNLIPLHVLFVFRVFCFATGTVHAKSVLVSREFAFVWTLGFVRNVS
jgi:hypothetical protein